MANTETNIELIENYLSGNLSGSEKQIFEQQLLSDSALKDELSFQKMLKESIIDYRKAEIKARLNNITPASGSTGTSWLVGIAASAVIGVSAWFGFQYLNNTKDTNVKVATETKTVAPVTQLEETTINTSTPIVESTKETNVSLATPSKVSSKRTKSKQIVKNTESDELILTSVPIAPEEPIVSANEHHVNVNNAEISHNNKSHSVIQASSIPTPIIKNSKDKFQYTHTAEQLMLWGDFSKSPYEILELNKNKEKRTFLYYEHEFYELHNNVSDPKNLEKLGDKTLIQELKQRLKHK